MDLFLALLGAHLFLALIFVTLLYFDHETPREIKIKHAAIALLIPFFGALYAAGAFRARRPKGRYNSPSIDENTTALTAFGVIGAGAAIGHSGNTSAHSSAGLGGGDCGWSDGGGSAGDGGGCGGGGD